MKQLWLLATVMSVMTVMGANTWTGEGADNKWSTPENWSSGVPSSATKELASIPAGEDITIEIDGDCSCYQLSLASGTGQVTFTGSGTLTTATDSTCYLNILAGRTLVVNGPEIVPHVSSVYSANLVVKRGRFELDGNSKFASFYGTATVLIEDGEFGANTMLTNTASLVAKGGVVRVKPLRLRAGTTLRLLSGSELYLQNDWPVIHTDATFENLGGTIYGRRKTGGGEDSGFEMQVSSQSRLLPYSKDATLNLLASRIALAFNDAAADSYDFSGTVLVTNTISTTPIISVEKAVAINGRPTIITGSLLYTPQKVNSAWDVEALVLKGVMRANYKNPLLSSAASRSVPLVTGRRPY